MANPNFGSSDKVDRIEKGTGEVCEHSLQVGNAVVVFNNIGTISLIDGLNSPWPLLLGGVLLLFGLMSLFGPSVLKFLGFILLIGGVALIYWGRTRKPDRFLSIGTCDGRRTNIVSKDREGLVELRNFLRRKIDHGLGMGKFTVTAEKIGIVAIGDDNRFTGGSL